MVRRRRMGLEKSRISKSSRAEGQVNGVGAPAPPRPPRSPPARCVVTIFGQPKLALVALSEESRTTLPSVHRETRTTRPSTYTRAWRVAHDSIQHLHTDTSTCGGWLPKAVPLPAPPSHQCVNTAGVGVSLSHGALRSLPALSCMGSHSELDPASLLVGFACGVLSSPGVALLHTGIMFAVNLIEPGDSDRLA